MTREEAIKFLKLDKEDRGKCLISDAIEMAIKALEQEPVIDKIRAEIAELSHYYPMGHDYQIAITRCLAVLDKYKAENNL